MTLQEIAELKNNYLQEMTKSMRFSKEESELISSLNSFRYFKKGVSLLKNGQFSETSFYVIKGCLVAYIIVDDEEKITDFYAEGDLFTPSCGLTNKPSTSYLVCLEDSLVSIGNPENEKILLEKFPRFEKLCRVSTEKSLLAQKLEFEKFKFATPEERYIHFANTKPSLLQRVSQYQIASYLGLTPQSLSRIRRRLLKPEKRHDKVAV